jgi:sarcosine oxidase
MPTPSRSYDVIVAGLGAMGSAATYELSARGVRVLGLDRFAPPHTLGSTHGRTRIIREAYFEHPLYVPLVRRAYERWDALAAAIGEPTYIITGGLMIGPSGGPLVTGAVASAREHDIEHDLLDAATLRRRYPVLRPPEGAVALLERRAGLLFPELCIRAYLDLAARQGATLGLEEPITSWEEEGDGVRVHTTRGTHSARRLLLAVGAWLPELARDDRLPLEVERQTLHWFAARERPDELKAARMPLALWELENERLFATFPDTGDGVKVGVHHEGEITTPDTVRRATSPEEDEDVRALTARVIPAAAGRLLEARVCLYTNTPDHHFLIDQHPAHPAVLVASPCSGHGFKFASAIGEVLADLLTDEKPAFDLAPFSLARFGARSGLRIA